MFKSRTSIKSNIANYLQVLQGTQNSIENFYTNICSELFNFTKNELNISAIYLHVSLNFGI